MSDHDHDHPEDVGKKEIDFSLWWKLLGYARPYRRDVAILITGGVMVAIADVGYPFVTKRIIDSVAVDGGRHLWLHGLSFLGLLLFGCLGVWLFIRMAGTVRFCASHDIRRDGFDNLQRLSFSFYDRRSVGWLMARMTSDCDRLSNILAWGILDLFWGVTLLTGSIAVMLALNWQLALLVMAVLPVVAWVSAVFRKRILGTARKVRKANSRITAAYNESIMGVKTSKVFVRERENLEDFRGLSTDMFQVSVKNHLQSALFLPIVIALGSVATGVALVKGGADVALGMSIGTLIAFMGYSRHFFDPIQELAHWFAELQIAQASAERILGLIATEPEILDSDEVARAIEEHRGKEFAGLAEDGLPDRIGEIRFEGVGFAYRDGPRVLTDFDLTIRAGETVALVGATGGGKTTIVSLLCRFYEPTEGRILIDGTDYRERSLHWLQSSLGIVLQSPHLFSGTIAENIRYGELDATDEEIETAARLAGAHDFISGLKDGYLTEVGEGGVMLSTGEKQLVSFARAILKRPRILVMDEATSSVDTETEKRIQAGLRRVLSGRTSLVIAHRLSTIRSADRILVVEHGRIVEEGKHGELLTAKGRYHELYSQQSLRETVRNGRVWT